jgi:hypothetical protein
MAVSNELAAREREVIFDDMDGVTQEAATQGATKFMQISQIAALVAYDLGTLVDNVYSAEHFNESQRKREIKKLAAYWNQPQMSPTKLYDLRNVAVAFDREFIKSQVEERLSNGNFLTWSHFKELQKVGSVDRQLAILKNCRKHSWSANELTLELTSKKEVEIKRSGGRKPTLPSTPNAMLQKLYTTVGQSNNYISAVTEPLEGIFMEMGPRSVDKDFLKSLDDTLARIADTSSKMQVTTDRLNRVRERTVEVLKIKATPSALPLTHLRLKQLDKVLAASAKKRASSTPEIQEHKKPVKRKSPNSASEGIIVPDVKLSDNDLDF